MKLPINYFLLSQYLPHPLDSYALYSTASLSTSPSNDLSSLQEAQFVTRPHFHPPSAPPPPSPARIGRATSF
ncbi:hypothetical protein GQ43DRAFT_443931 [Delitschia confertaspora ATCC 74209]|uniref:Uncharacterized protein n=1 Tax=Delitschia confertaspora ATCC 74209 TaxID=1513339 RepID=A0A9P4JJS8_9PLEO|nr:hypothetical protein GQ43DRAFT_443931 [Delitschia confertaspora ATCC 74209]